MFADGLLSVKSGKIGYFNIPANAQNQGVSGLLTLLTEDWSE